MDKNYITSHKILENELKKIIEEYKLSNLVIQNKILILINKLYCDTNLLILKIVLNNLGFANYKLVYEEDIYKHIKKPILCIWNKYGIYIDEEQEKYIDIKNNDLSLLKPDTTIITSNKDIEALKGNFVIYENTTDPIFNMMEEYFK